eukprot:COSAG03_NODE_17873_length_366_cov_1.123596_1_plen_27_part_10
MSHRVEGEPSHMHPGNVVDGSTELRLG